MGTAVSVQAMVFGNMGDDCATGVAFTRNPSTGEKAVYGEFLINAQGEDVVAGIRTPQASERGHGSGGWQARHLDGGAAAAILCVAGRGVRRGSSATTATCRTSSSPSRAGRLWMLQTRSGKRTANAAFKVAVDMAEEGLISRDEAVLRVDPASLDQLLHPTLDPECRAENHRQGAAGLAGCGVGQGGVHRREGRSCWAMPARRWSWSGWRPRRTISMACTRLWASSPHEGA